MPLTIAALLVALAVVVLVVESGADALPTLPRGAVRIDVGATPAGRPVAPGFVGLSIEYPSAPYYFGRDPAHVDPVFVALVRGLTPGQSPVLRFGGDTTDWTWAATPGAPRPGGVRYTLGSRWLAVTRAAAAALNARLIPGINFEADSPAVAGGEADALLRGLGPAHIAGFELGNEPEVYGALPWYTRAGVAHLGRPSSYGFSAYLSDYARVAAALPGSVPLIGPASGSPDWLNGLPRYLRANSRVREVTFHRYPLHRCYTPPSSPDYPTIGNLLSPIAATGPADSLAAAVSVAHAHGLPFRSDELNSVSCGGAHGVSDTFASALWVLDTLFNMARVGVDGVNIHTFHKAIYQPFAFRDAGGRWTAQVKPLYYGLLLFARAAPPGSRLLPATEPAVAGLRVWATRARDGTVRTVLINDSARRWVTAAIRVPGAGSGATAVRLRAPQLAARRDITLGGQSFGPSTATGTLGGSPRTVSLAAAQGRFAVRLPPASATLVTAGGG